MDFVVEVHIDSSDDTHGYFVKKPLICISVLERDLVGGGEAEYMRGRGGSWGVARCWRPTVKQLILFPIVSLLLSLHPICSLIAKGHLY